MAKRGADTNADELGARCLSLYALLVSSDSCAPPISATALVLPTAIFTVLCSSNSPCVRVVDTRLLWHWILVMCILIGFKLARNWIFYCTPPSISAFSAKWLYHLCFQPCVTREGVTVTTVVPVESYFFRGLRALEDHGGLSALKYTQTFITQHQLNAIYSTYL